MHSFNRDCKTEIGNIVTQTDAISKRKKIAIPDWRQMKKKIKEFQNNLRFNIVFRRFIG